MHEPRHHLTSFATPESIRAPAFPASLSGTPDQVGDYPRDIRSPPSSLRGASRRSNLQPSTRWDACWRLLRSARTDVYGRGGGNRQPDSSPQTEHLSFSSHTFYT